MLRGGAIYYYHTNHLGTPQALTDKDRRLVWRAGYTPFGDTIITANEVENSLRFPGQYFDAETGLHYNHFRDYDPNIGRYIQSDPIGLGSGPSTYLYVTANPLANTDRLGLLNLIGGVGGSGVAVLGADVSGGIAVNVDSTDVLSNIAQFGSVGLAAGVNVSADVFGGVILGGLENVEGTTENINLVLPGGSVTIITKSGVGPIGVTFGVGRSLLPIGFSLSSNSTGIATIEGYIEIVETVKELFRDFPRKLIRAPKGCP
jgi:RHS repeat-associated protein